MEKEYEIRSMCGELRVREAVQNADGSITQSRTIYGKAIAFNSISEVLYDDVNHLFFREIIKPEACTAEFLREQDVKLNMLHVREGTIARNNKGVGNLRWEVREDGVYFEFDAPKCDLGDRCLALVREGVYTGCSFEFREDEKYTECTTVVEGGKKIPLLTHHKLRYVSALTIGMDPAYSKTHVNARELATLVNDNDPDAEAAKREAEEQAAKEEAERKAAEEQAEKEAAEKAEREKFTRERTLRECQASIDTALL